MKSLIVKSFSIISLFIASAVFAGEDNGYSIKIFVKGLDSGDVCTLANYYGEKQYIQDSAIVDDKGWAIFKDEEKLKQGIYLFVPPNNKYFELVIDEGQNFTLETDTTDYIKYMKVKGSEENKYFFDYQQFMADMQTDIKPLREQYKLSKDNEDSVKLLKDQMAVIDDKVKKYKENLYKNHPDVFVSKILKAIEEPEVPEAPTLPNGRKDSTFSFRYYKAHYFDNMDFTDDRMLRTPIFHSRVSQYIDKMTAQTPDSINVEADYLIEKCRPNPEMFKYMVWWLTSKYEGSKIMGMDAVFVHLGEKYYLSKQAYWLDSAQYAKMYERVTVMKPLLIGKYAPTINMTDTSGIRTSLYDLNAKYTVVIFWDHGCGHCKKEVPKLARLYDTVLKDMGVKVFAVETENKPDEWKAFIRKHNLNWTNVYEADDYSRAVTKKFYDIYSTPVIYLLDENKKILGKRIESTQLPELIEMLEKRKKEEKEEKKDKEKKN